MAAEDRQEQLELTLEKQKKMLSKIVAEDEKINKSISFHLNCINKSKTVLKNNAIIRQKLTYEIKALTEQLDFQEFKERTGFNLSDIKMDVLSNIIKTNLSILKKSSELDNDEQIVKKDFEVDDSNISDLEENDTSILKEAEK